LSEHLNCEVEIAEVFVPLVCGKTMFGMSFVYVAFEVGTDIDYTNWRGEQLSWRRIGERRPSPITAS